MPADAGIKFGSYVLLRRIARGGMAEVFLAQQRGLEGFDRRVAVKRILPHLVDSPDFVKMFLSEAKLAAQLGHPNVVHIYDFGKVDHDYFLAMEYVDGVHAGQIWKHGETKDRITPTLVARIGADAATALHHAHELKSSSGKLYGLVHRDVSPANIMVSFEGVVKLCDFGIAKAAALSDQLTNPGQVKGKYAYMSPEQTVAQPLDGRSDVFSLGVVMWELLSGKFIVPRGDAVAAMRAIRDGKIDPIAQVAPETPPGLAKALDWALQPTRELRATAAELAQALEAFIKSSPEIATAMQLGGWIRQRFIRDQTGQVPAIPGGSGHGTQVSPGTVASPETGPSDQQSAVTPQPAPPPPKHGANLSFDDLDEAQDTLKVKPFVKPPTANPPTAKPLTAKPFDEAPTFKRPTPPPKPSFAPSGSLTIAEPIIDATVIDKPLGPLTPDTGIDAATRAADAPTQIASGRAMIAPDAEPSDVNETIVRTSGKVMPISSGPAIVPTAIVAPSSVPQPRVNEPARPSSSDPSRSSTSGPEGFVWPLHFFTRRRRGSADRSRERRIRIAFAIIGMFGLAAISFVIALAASGSRHTATPPDAAPVVTAVPDATVAAAVQDAHPIAADANLEAYLEVSTIPDGGKIRVGDQTRTAPAQIIVVAGTMDVTAELAGYQLETRSVVIEVGEHQKIEVAFTHKLGLGGHPAAATGKLSVRTTPYAEVFEAGKKIAETPFADREMSAGVHTLTFKNPAHSTLTKKLTISAGKTTKLTFALP